MYIYIYIYVHICTAYGDATRIFYGFPLTWHRIEPSPQPSLCIVFLPPTSNPWHFWWKMTQRKPKHTNINIHIYIYIYIYIVFFINIITQTKSKIYKNLFPCFLVKPLGTLSPPRQQVGNSWLLRYLSCLPGPMCVMTTIIHILCNHSPAFNVNVMQFLCTGGLFLVRFQIWNKLFNG